MTAVRVLLAGLAVLYGVVLPFASASAAESAPVRTSRVTATLVTSSDTVQPGGSIEAGLYLRLAPGWHTYWRNPGDAGAASELSFDLPPGDTAGPIKWPLPMRMAEGDLTTYAYQGDVLLPVTLTVDSAPLTLKAHASWLVCKDICVPEQGDFTIPLSNGTVAPSAQAPLFAAASSTVPRATPLQSTIAPDGTLRLSGPGLPTDVTTAEFFPTGDGIVETTGAQTPVRSGDTLALHLALGAAHPGSTVLDGVVALTGPHSHTEIYTIAAVPGGAPMASSQPVTWLLVAALAGGLLLNLMPCVFPVLAMKAMALARLAGGDRRIVRREAASYTLGVLATFTGLGAVLLALRAGGDAAGWGFQFQSPVFVTAVAWVLFATGLNMSGVFTLGESVAGAGQSLAARGGHLGSFFTGMLAVVVATPCTAAFMGAAIAGALESSAGVALAIFAAMGLGLAMPYAIVAVLPRLATLMPRPGRWMQTLRQALAFPMYGAAAWLVWVVSQQTGSTGVLIAGAGLVALGFAGWAFGVAQASTGKGRYVGYGAMLVGTVCAVALLTIRPGTGAEVSEPFSTARLTELQGEGRPVFVNMTAAWCLSCLVNERLALSPAAVRSAFAQAHVAYLKGDWTRKDPTISAFLRDHDRDGVPLYVFYPPGKPPVILPQLLTEGDLLSQVARLRG